MRIPLLSICFVMLFASFAYPLSINDNAPLFSLRDNHGNFFHLSSYVGVKKKYPVKGIILNFFASYCKPCKNELPVLNSLVEEFERKGIKVVIAGYREDFDKIMDMLAGIKVSDPVILSDVYGKIGEKYGVKGLPMTVFIGADGRVKDIMRGELPNIENILREKTGRLLQ